MQVNGGLDHIPLYKNVLEVHFTSLITLNIRFRTKFGLGLYGSCTSLDCWHRF